MGRGDRAQSSFSSGQIQSQGHPNLGKQSWTPTSHSTCWTSHVTLTAESQQLRLPEFFSDPPAMSVGEQTPLGGVSCCLLSRPRTRRSQTFGFGAQPTMVSSHTPRIGALSGASESFQSSRLAQGRKLGHREDIGVTWGTSWGPQGLLQRRS